MTKQQALKFVTASEYLAGERDGQIRHEYVAGQVFAMTGGSVYHNRINGNIFALLKEKLCRRPCDVFISDMKVQTDQAYYYPDVMVVCDPKDRDPYSKTAPTVIVEVTSPTTRSTDEREKRLAYLSIATLQEYVLVEQDRPEARVLRRADTGSWEQVGLGADDLMVLHSLDIVIPMQSIYEGVWR